MQENQEVLPENRGEEVIRAREQSPQKSPESPKEKASKPWLIPVIIASILIVSTVLALLLGGANGDNGSPLSDNINDTGVNWEKYEGSEITLSGSGKKTITEAGVYILSGELSDGYIEINTSGAVKLILNGVKITNNSGPAIYVAEAKLVTIETAEGSENTLTDGSIYSGWDEDVCAALFSHDDLVLQGSGTLTVNGNYEDGIVGKDDLKIVSGTYIVNSKDDGIRGRDSLYIVDGTFEITSGGDSFKSNNSDEVAKGWIKIDGGSITASAGDDGIHAESSLEINGGTIRVTKSYEGLEGAKITINGGDIAVAASDDGVNAAGGNDGSSPNMKNYQSSSSNYAIYMNGGTLYVNAAGDGIDSNGAIYMNGGTAIVDGPTNAGNGALDAETGVVYNGGTLIAVGASGMAVAPNTSSAKYSLSVFFSQTYSAGTVIEVKDTSGNTILTHTSLKSFQHASLSSDQFVENGEYTVYINGEEYTTTQLAEKTTQVGSGMMNGGGMMPGGAPNQMNGGQQRRW
ncbi:carbohydrate-binding domain-containing protein [Candidatus Saccharibacteria bacterium]|nr:carbohydrate-binding domain-containing protein [Candidatus Saccharibacteria bacterium]